MRIERLSNAAAWMSAYGPYDPKRTLMPVVGIRQGPAAGGLRREAGQSEAATKQVTGEAQSGGESSDLLLDGTTV
jgi:hypothetical protein